MSQYPLARRDTRVRFSIDNGNPQVGDNPPGDREHRQVNSSSLNPPEPVHAPRAHDPTSHSRRSTGSQPGPFSPPQGYHPDPHVDGQRIERGHDPGFVQATRPMPPGSRFTLDEGDETHPHDAPDKGHSPHPSQGRAKVQQPGDPNMQIEGDPYENEGNTPRGVDNNNPLGTNGVGPLSRCPIPLQNALRSAMRRSYSEEFPAPGVARAASGSTLEAGIHAPRGQPGVFSNFMQSYGFSRRISEGSVSTAIDSRYQSQAVSRANSNESAGALLRLRRMRRRDSALSFGGDTLLDDDDPRVTGVKPNRIDDENKARETFKDSVVHDEIGAKDGTLELAKLMRQKPIYGLRIRCVLALLCSAIICPIGFGGSFADMWIAGCAGATLCWLQLHAASKSALYSNVFEISAAMMVSFVARGLSSIPSGIFCYSAISSAGVVLILPGYMVWFSLTIGSDLYFLVDPSARHRREAATAALDSQVTIHGQFRSDNMTIFPFNGTFIFKNVTADAPSTSHYQAKGCYRDLNWPWYLQALPGWTLFVLVPLFSLFGSLASMQPLKSTQLPVMVFISCAAFAANKAANRYIFDRSDVVSAIGAFVVGVLGNLYSRVFRGTAFVVMVNGIGFLIPSGIAAAGGLAQNYRGSEGDQYSSGLSLGFRMVQVAIGVTVGLFGSGLIVYSFGSRKRGALFAF
ncbi:hypothetical protein FRC11_011995 [Ceratobasidium sp. 423]|nr:hypothetical protein FRC11_011995 [Ceratobasidium sp. 423]